MQKKIEIKDLDIPKDDIECWERYPKYHWVYELSRLFDAQGIKWSPYSTNTLNNQVVNMYLESSENIAYLPAWIFISNPIGKQIHTEVFIVKGEIKYIRYYCNDNKKLINENIGDVELRINAFISIHFQKFTGVISVETVGTDIYSIRLRPLPELALVVNPEVTKLIKRIYKKNNVMQLIGLTDQHLREAIAS